MQSPLHLQQPSPKTLARDKFQDRDWGRRGLKEEGTRKGDKNNEGVGPLFTSFSA